MSRLATRRMSGGGGRDPGGRGVVMELEKWWKMFSSSFFPSFSPSSSSSLSSSCSGYFIDPCFHSGVIESMNDGRFQRCQT